MVQAHLNYIPSIVHYNFYLTCLVRKLTESDFLLFCEVMSDECIPEEPNSVDEPEERQERKTT